MIRGIRRISTKWVLAVLAAVVVPFVGFAVFVDTKVSERLSDDVVRHYLLTMAADLAYRIDEEIEERRQDVEQLAITPVIEWFVGDYDAAETGAAGDSGSDGSDRPIFLPNVHRIFNGQVQTRDVYDFVVAIDDEGKAVATNQVDAEGLTIPADVIMRIEARDFSSEEWFRHAIEHGSAIIDFHHLDVGYPQAVEGEPAGYYIGFVHRIDSSYEARAPVGVVLTLMNWRHVQAEVSSYGVRHLEESGSHAIGLDIYDTSYAWIWKSDADTIIAHPTRALYGEKVSGPRVNLPQLVEAARSKEWGMYPEYTFNDVRKNAAFKRCKRAEEGGFAWVVGVGVDNENIYAPVKELSRLLFTSSAIVLGLAILFTVFTAHRTTRPILELQQHTRRIAGGDLDARIDVKTRDELGDLASSFNTMTSELKENREQLVRAEKDAAWREMARQVAHEIKNPLTPISLSAGLLKRAHDERSPEFEAILDRTIEMIQRQVENMREIAKDFYAFAGEHKEPAPVDVGGLVDDVLDLNDAWAIEHGIAIHRSGGGGLVDADADELRRALINLVSNAIESMPDGGDLYASVEVQNGEVLVEFRDTGPGLGEEAESRLFEPYFTTRSSGTGLGLAIVRRVVEDLGGTVALANAADGPGAIASVRLPCSNGGHGAG